MSSNARARHHGLPHAQEDIRDSTMQLSSIPFRSPLSAQESFIWPISVGPTPEVESLSTTTSFSSALPPDEQDFNRDVIDIVVSGASSSTNTAATTPRGPGGSFHPSGLSLLLARQTEAATTQLSSNQLSTTATEHSIDTQSPSVQSVARSVPTQDARSVGATSALSLASEHEHERAPLLGDVESSFPSYTANGGPDRSVNTTPLNGHATPEAVSKRTARGILAGWHYRAFRPTSLDSVRDVATTAVRSLPAVLLGTLLNILDGVSCAYACVRHRDRR